MSRDGTYQRTKDRDMELLIKQCTNLQSFDASIYTVIGILSPGTYAVIEDIDNRNSGISYTMRVDHKEIVYTPHTFAHKDRQEMLKTFLKHSDRKDILLFSDSSPHTEAAMTILIKLCLEEGLQPIVLIKTNAYSKNAQERFIASKANIVLRDGYCHSSESCSYEDSMLYNHTVSNIAHSTGFDGGLGGTGFIYDYAKEIMTQESFDRYHFSGCIDNRGLLPFWTPWSRLRTPCPQTRMKDKKEPVESSEDIFTIDIVDPCDWYRQ